MRDLLTLLEGLLFEGGNIWKDDLATIRIKQKDVMPTVQFLEKVTGINLSKNLLGSTGLKDTSGDLDIGIDATKYNKNDLQARLNAWAQNNDSKSLTAKSGVSVHFRTPINGNPKNGYVQTDFMFLDDLPFSKWSMSAPPSFFKGAHKHILLASVAKSLGLKWSFQKGLMDRNTGETLPKGKDPNYVAQTLFGKGATADTISTVEKMLSVLEKDPNKEQKLQDFRNQVPELSDYENNALKEDDEQPTITKQLSKQELEQKLRDNGFSDLKVSGNKITVLTQIPDGQKKLEFRIALLQEILDNLKIELKQYNPQYSDDASLKSSIGGIVFPNSPLHIVVKDSGKQGEKSAGVANEIELGSLIQSVIEKFGNANVAFTDPRGVKLTIENATEVEIAGRTTAGRRKADVIIKSPNSKLPISIKKVNADMWESADNLFGQRARQVIEKLVDEGVVELKKIKELKGKPVYELSKEIVMEPTEQEALQAIFGSDINPEGGIVIQTFKPEHFKQDGNNVDVDAHAVIINKDDIPESHVMYWILRNDETRNSKSLGIPGIRPLGVTAKRALGAKGTKDVIVVDSEGNVIKSSVAPSKKEKEEKPDWVDKMKNPNLSVGREKRNV